MFYLILIKINKNQYKSKRDGTFHWAGLGISDGHARVRCKQLRQQFKFHLPFSALVTSVPPSPLFLREILQFFILVTNSRNMFWLKLGTHSNHVSKSFVYKYNHLLSLTDWLKVKSMEHYQTSLKGSKKYKYIVYILPLPSFTRNLRYQKYVHRESRKKILKESP